MSSSANMSGATVVGGARGARGALGKLTLMLWAAALLVVGAFLMAGHVVGLPTPALADVRVDSTSPTPSSVDRGRWSVTHVLYEGCGCSARVMARLVGRGALPDVLETVVYVRDGVGAGAPGAAPAAVSDPLRQAGFKIETLAPAALVARYHVESAPVLLVGDPQGNTRYVGGYTDHSGAKNIRDLEIIAAIRKGGDAAALPVFGCAVSSRVQRAIDPLGLKYQGASR